MRLRHTLRRSGAAGRVDNIGKRREGDSEPSDLDFVLLAKKVHISRTCHYSRTPNMIINPKLGIHVRKDDRLIFSSPSCMLPDPHP
jgi:hypothetical protein